MVDLLVMSTRTSYKNMSTLGIIDIIYCTELPSDVMPTGKWVISFKDRRPHSYIDKMTTNDFYYYEDKNIYLKAVINAQEVARKYMSADERTCRCTIM